MAKQSKKKRSVEKVINRNRPVRKKPINWRTIGIVLGVVAFAVAMYQSRPDKPSPLAGMHHAPSGPGKIEITPPDSVPRYLSSRNEKISGKLYSMSWRMGTGNRKRPNIGSVYIKVRNPPQKMFALEFNIYRLMRQFLGDSEILS